MWLQPVFYMIITVVFNHMSDAMYLQIRISGNRHFLPVTGMQMWTKKKLKRWDLPDWKKQNQRVTAEFKNIINKKLNKTWPCQTTYLTVIFSYVVLTLVFTCYYCHFCFRPQIPESPAVDCVATFVSGLRFLRALRLMSIVTFVAGLRFLRALRLIVLPLLFQASDSLEPCGWCLLSLLFQASDSWEPCGWCLLPLLFQASDSWEPCGWCPSPTSWRIWTSWKRARSSGWCSSLLTSSVCGWPRQDFYIWYVTAVITNSVVVCLLLLLLLLGWSYLYCWGCLGEME